MPKKFKIAEIEPSKLSLKISEYLTGSPSEDSLKEILAKYDFSQQQLQNAIDLSLGDSVTQFSSALFRNTVGDEALAEKSLELAKNAGYNLLGIIMRYLETNELAIYLRVLLIKNENDFKTLFNDLSNNTTSSDKIYKYRVEGKYKYGTPYMTHNDVKKEFYISSIFNSAKIMQPRETQTKKLNKLPSTFLEFFYKNDIDYNHIRYYLDKSRTFKETKERVDTANSIYKKNGFTNVHAYASVLEALLKHNPAEAQVEMANSIYKENGFAWGHDYAEVLEAVTKHNPTEAQAKMANSICKENGFTHGFDYAEVLEALLKHNPAEAQAKMANSICKENGFALGHYYANALNAVLKHNLTEAQAKMVNSIYEENGFAWGHYYADVLEAVTKHNPTEAQVEMANSIYKENGLKSSLDYANALNAVLKHNPTEAQVESMILYNQAINKQVDKKAHAIEEFCKDAANIGSTHNSDNYFTQMPTSDEMMNYYLTYHLIKDRFGGDFCSMLDGFAEGSKKSCLEARDNMDMAMTLGLSVLFPDQSYYFAYPIVLSVMHNGIARLPDYINDIIPDNEILKHSANIVLSCGVSFAFSPHPTLSCGAFLTHYAQKAVSDHALDITEIDVIKHDVKYAFKYSFLAYGCVTIAKVSWENKTLPEYKKVLPFFLAYDVTIMLFDMAIDTAVVFPDILSAVYNSSVSNITNVIVELDVEVSQLVNWVANQFETPA